ncbi:MAG: PTS sugar transporter subunit IIB [Microbacteriaceae bacterium]
MRIVAVCGMGIGTSVLLKMNIEKVLNQMGLTATVEAADMKTARSAGFDANIVMTTPDLVPLLDGLAAEIIEIEHFFDLEELQTKLAKALL